jgi:hypothetical protein
MKLHELLVLILFCYSYDKLDGWLLFGHNNFVAIVADIRGVLLLRYRSARNPCSFVRESEYRAPLFENLGKSTRTTVVKSVYRIRWRLPRGGP